VDTQNPNHIKGIRKVVQNMNVLIVNASPRKKGIASTLLAEVRKRIQPKHTVDVVRIQELNIKACIGYLKCRPDKTCVLPRDDAHHLGRNNQRSRSFDYWHTCLLGQHAGGFKNIFDRNVPLFEYCEAKAIKSIPKPQLKGKRAILIVSGGSPFPYHLLPSQSRGTIRSLKTVLKSGGIKITSVLNVSNTYNFGTKKHYYFNKVKRLARSIQQQREPRAFICQVFNPHICFQRWADNDSIAYYFMSSAIMLLTIAMDFR